MSNPESGVYVTADICRLFACGINEVNRLIDAGVIPPPLAYDSPRLKKRWLKSAVNKKLGIKNEELTETKIRELIAEVVNAAGN